MAEKLLSMSGITVTMLAAQPALAITPPIGPPQYSAYGPVQICAADFQIDVRADEAVHIAGNITRLLHDDYLISAIPATFAPGTLGPDLAVPIAPIMLGAGRAAIPFTWVTPDPEAEVRFAPQALGPNDIRYAVSVPGDDSRFIIVGSTAFTGQASDTSILVRMLSTEKKHADCIRPEIARSLSYSVNATDEAKRAQEKQSYQARIYPPKPDTGRVFYCMGGIGFALKRGEILYRPWKSLGEAGEAMVGMGGVSIKIRRREEPLHRADENNVNEHPLGLLHQSRIIYHPSRGIGPPYAPEGVREDGSWEIELGKYPRQRMFIDFPASEKTPVGFRFLERLQFVEKNDPRCT